MTLRIGDTTREVQDAVVRRTNAVTPADGAGAKNRATSIPGGVAAGVGGEDSVSISISNPARDLLSFEAEERRRAERLEAIKSQVASGTYLSSVRTSDVAESFIKEVREVSRLAPTLVKPDTVEEGRDE